MSSIVITGTQWGDEGKGKIVDVLTEDAQVVARYQGGHNAGHTVVIRDDKFILHLVPSGILHKGKVSIIGNGTVIEPGSLLKEIDGLRTRGVEVSGDNLLISDRAHLIMPWHIALDGASENKLGSGKIGTTGRGIGPAYVDKMGRTGITAGDLLRPQVLKAKIEKALAFTNEVLTKVYGLQAFNANEVYAAFLEHAKRLAPHITETGLVLDQALEQNKNVLFEGAQGTLLDVDHGTYPFVTSSSSAAGGVCTGTGVGPARVGRVLGIVKAYTTRVGSGPFPTELTDAIGQGIQQRGAEFGATTGRPRRCGWLDIVALRYAARINSLAGIIITKLDILSGVDELKLCTAYEINGKRTEHFPSDAQDLDIAKPLYELTLKGWSESTSGITDFDRLPTNAKKYVNTIESLLKTPAFMVSTGPRRDELIVLKKAF